VRFLRDSYEYEYLDKRVQVEGRSVKWLYRNPPLGYD
jgi:hypothetical protein